MPFWPTWRENRAFAVALLILIAYMVVFLGFMIKKTLLETMEIGKPAPIEHTIYIDGTGKADGAADTAEVIVNVQTRNAVEADAQKNNSATMNTLIEKMKGLDIAAEDLQSQNYSIWQDYVYDMTTNESKPGDWIASQDLIVKIHDVTKVSSVLDVAGQNGGSISSGPNFSLDDNTAVKNEARNKAIKDAMEKIQALENQLGVRVVRVIGYSEYVQDMYPLAYGKGGMMMENASVMPKVEPGQVEMNLTVSISFLLKD